MEILLGLILVVMARWCWTAFFIVKIMWGHFPAIGALILGIKSETFQSFRETRHLLLHNFLGYLIDLAFFPSFMIHLDLLKIAQRTHFT